MPLAISKRCAFNRVTVFSQAGSDALISPTNQSSLQSPQLYTTFGPRTESLIRGSLRWLLSLLILLCLHLPALHAQVRYYVNSPNVDLNIRNGPGERYKVLTRLPHGTPVLVQDRNRSWLKIVAPTQRIEGWAAGRYLSEQPPDDPLPPGELSRRKEEQHFKRLRNKGFIRVQANRTRGVLLIRMNNLIWQRFNRQQQKNFLERASRYYRISRVELRDLRGITRSRLSANGPNAFRFESVN